MRRLIIIVLVLVGVLVAADFGAAALAESAVSRQMRGELGLVDDPSVRINGFPFLTQAIAGTYPSVDVDATRIPYGSFKELEINARLHDVSAPLSMLLGSGQKSITAASRPSLSRRFPSATSPWNQRSTPSHGVSSALAQISRASSTSTRPANSSSARRAIAS